MAMCRTAGLHNETNVFYGFSRKARIWVTSWAVSRKAPKPRWAPTVDAGVGISVAPGEAGS